MDELPDDMKVEILSSLKCCAQDFLSLACVSKSFYEKAVTCKNMLLIFEDPCSIMIDECFINDIILRINHVPEENIISLLKKIDTRTLAHAVRYSFSKIKPIAIEPIYQELVIEYQDPSVDLKVEITEALGIIQNRRRLSAHDWIVKTLMMGVFSFMSAENSLLLFLFILAISIGNVLYM